MMISVSRVVSGNNASVEGAAITSVCNATIVVTGSYNEIEGNSITRANSNPGGGGPANVINGGLTNNGHNRILHNEVGAAGPFSDGIVVGTLTDPSPGNLIEENNFSGNPLIGSFIAPGSTGNVVRHNQALGNLGSDIADFNGAGANTYNNNLCQTASGGASCQLPNIAGHTNFHPDGD